MQLFFNKVILKFIFFIIDSSIIVGSFICAWWVRFNVLDNIKSDNNISDYNLVIWISLLSWALISLIFNIYHVPHNKSKKSIWYYYVFPQVIFIFINLMAIVFFNLDQIPRLFILFYFLINFFGLLLTRQIRFRIINYLRETKYDQVKLSIISDITNERRLIEWLKKHQDSGFIYGNPINSGGEEENFRNKAFQIIDNQTLGDYLIIDDIKDLTSKDIVKIKELAENKGVHLFHIIHLSKLSSSKDRNGSIRRMGPFDVIKLRHEPVKNGFNQIIKRTFDFLFSLLFIIAVYWWVYLLVGLAIKLTSKGPIIFKQERVGLNGLNFYCYKFRTMSHDVSADVKKQSITQRDDKRVSSVGVFLRKTNIDEFPQFINVFNGDMSVVGPRPHMLSEDIMLAEKIDKYRLRYWVKPGITGLAAIKGFRGGTESLLLMQQRIDLDIKYIETWSIWLDIKICFLTAIETLTGSGKGD